MAELSALHIKITGDASGAQAELRGLTAHLRSTGAQVETVTGETAKARKGFAMMAGGSRMLTMQLSQVAQQAMAGGGAMRALAIQAPDIGMAFGTLGTIVGTVAGLSLPLLIGALGGASRETETLEDSVKNLSGALGDFESNAEMLSRRGLHELYLKYGDIAEQIARVIERQQRLNVLAAQMNFRSVVTQLTDMTDAFTIAGVLFDGQLERTSALAKSLDITTVSARRLVDYFDRLAVAQGPMEQAAAMENLRDAMVRVLTSQDEMTQEHVELIARIDESVTAMYMLAGASGDTAGAISNAADEAERLRDGLSAAFNAASVRAGVASGAIPPEALADLPATAGETALEQIYGRRRREDRRESRGGGATKNPLIAELEALRRSVASEMELIEETYRQQQEVLQSALEQRLITQEEYQQLMEASAREHADALARINTGYHGDTLQQAGAFFGDMASAFSQGNEKMLRIAKVFGAAEALINSFRAFNQVLADPTLPWFAKIAAAAGVMGAGMGMVAAIKGVGKGGGQRSVGSAAAVGGSVSSGNSGSPASSANVAISLRGGDFYSRDSVIGLINKINEAIEDGAVIRVV